MYFSEQGWAHAITFFHTDAMHLGGISLECQWWLFFSVCSHLLWWLELLSTLTDKHRIDLRRAGMQRAKQAESPVAANHNTIPPAGFKVWPLQFKRSSSACCCLILTFVFEESLHCADNVTWRYTESDTFFRKFLQMLSLFMFVAPKHPSRFHC